VSKLGMEWIEQPILAQAGIPHGFGTRTSPARAGVRRPVQVHGDRVVSADAGLPLGEADASLSVEPGVAVGIVTADCVPVLVAAGGHAVAAVHAGWRGLARGVIPRALEALGEAAPGAELVAAIGPAIGPCCYEVGEELRVEFAPEFFRPGPRGKPHLDVRAANRAQLEAAGLRPERIHGVDECTYCRPDRYHSYRREGKGAGRMISYVGFAASPR
jgi:hypothetical protein